MSTWFDEPVTCPACGAIQIARLAHGVHASRAPEIRDQLFDRTFHRIECSGCARVFTGQRPLVYTDMDRKHWLQVALASERPRWPELEPATEQIFARAFTGSPLADREGFKLRLVFGLEELREKLVIWRSSLDDAVVECIKAHVTSRDPRHVRAAAIVVDAVAADGALELAIDGERLAVPAELVERFHADGRLPARFPELFGGRFVSLHRLTGPRYRWVK